MIFHVWDKRLLPICRKLSLDQGPMRGMPIVNFRSILYPFEVRVLVA